MIYFVASDENVHEVSSTVLLGLFGRIRSRENINASGILARLGKAGLLEAAAGTRPIAWKITDAGRAAVREALGLPEDSSELRAEIAELSKVASAVKSEEVRDFLREAIACLGVNALRATVVFVWSGAIWTIQEWLMRKRLKDVNDHIGRHQKTREVKSIDDFAFVSDATTLLVARDLGLWDKGQHKIVEQALDLRNQCGHPSRYSVLPSRCKSVIEELVQLVFERAA